MFTRCTACGTGFRINADQLGAQHGRVRCGSCGEVFSALDSLVESRDAQSENAALAGAGTHEHRDDQTADLFHSTGHTSEVARVEQAPPAPPENAAAVAVAVPPEPVASATFAPEPIAPEPLAPEPLAPEPAAPDLRTPEPTATQHAATAQPGVGMIMGESSLFLTPPPRRFPWLTLFGVLLGASTLAAQGAWFYRNELAVMVPATKPVLDAMCLHAGCSLEPTLDAQAISIEASDLQADPGNRAILTLTALIRNRAGFAQPLPHLEIALTDAQDTALAKRVLKPGQYTASQTRLAANGEAQVKLLIDAGQLKANGYRLYAFYP